MHETQRGAVSSNSRLKTVVFQQCSTNLSNKKESLHKEDPLGSPPSGRVSAVLHYITLHYIILSLLLCCIILYYATLHFNHIIIHHIALYYIILYYIILYYMLRYIILRGSGKSRRLRASGISASWAHGIGATGAPRSR